MTQLDQQFSGFGGDAKERMSELDRRISAGLLHRQKIVDMLTDVKDKIEKKLDEFKNKFNSFQDPNNLNVKEVKDLAKFSVGSFANIKDLEGGKIYRTEMVDKIEDFLNEKIKEGKIKPEKASEIIVAGMEELKYRSGSIEKTLFDAMRMVSGGKLLKVTERKKIEKSMQTGLSQVSPGVDKNNNGLIKIGDKEYTFNKVEVLTGAAMVDFTPQISSKFILQNVVMIDGQIWARMQNGCEGNLVIIPGITPVVPPDRPPVEPPPVPVVPPIIPEIPLEEQNSEHFISTTRDVGRVATVENQQFDEKIRQDFDAKILINNYDKAGIEGVLKAIESIPQANQQQVLGDFFAALNLKDSNKAAIASKELQRIIVSERSVYGTQILNVIDSKINSSTGDAKTVWEAQKALYELPTIVAAKAQEQIREVYQKLKKVNKSTLAFELQEMYEGLLEGLENSTRYLIAMDMLKTAQNTLQGTFTDMENLQEFMALPNADKVKSLRNEGNNWQDRDYEIFYSANQIFEGLIYLLQYQYPIDMQTTTIANPIEHYMGVLEGLANSGGQISLIAGVATNPPIFVDLSSEIKLFKDYQRGEEKMGESSIWNAFKGEKGAFLEHAGGLIEGSKRIFNASDVLNENETGDIKEKNKLGAAERLILTKIANAESQGHYEEARALCIEVLLDKFTPLSSSEINTRKDEIAIKEKTKIEAQVRQNLEAQGVTQATLSNKAGGTYSLLADYIDDLTKDQIEENAIIDLYGMQADKLNFNDTKFSQLDKLAIKSLQVLNGKGWRPSSENRDWTNSISKTLTEIIIVEVAIMLSGGLLAGAATAGTVGTMGSRTLSASRALRIQKAGLRAGGRLRNYVMGTRLGGTRVMGGLAAKGERATSYLAEGGAWHARGSKLLLHATAFTEGQAALHGDVVNPLTAEGAYQIGGMALTFWALGKTQQLLRGQTISAQKVAAGTANWAERNLMFGKLVNRYGTSMERGIGSIAGKTGKIGKGLLYGGVSTAEIGAEIMTMHYWTDIEERLAVEAYELTNGKVGFSQTQREAMHETESWRRWGHEAAVVLGLRTWRKAQERDRGSVGGESESLSRIAYESFNKDGSETLKKDPSAKLEHYKEIESYFKKQNIKYKKEIEKISKNLEPMDANCEMCFCIPAAAHQEGKNIYKALNSFKTQTANPKKYEIIIFANHPKTNNKGEKIRADNTVKEVIKFKKENPELKIQLIYKTFPIEDAKIGTMRKYASDIAMYRHHQRGAATQDLILVSMDADLKGISKFYVEKCTEYFRNNPGIDAARGELDWDLNAYSNNPAVYIGTRLFQYIGIHGRKIHNFQTSSGGNFLIKSSIYSAIGGHAKMGGGEDVIIGQKITLARQSRDTIGYPGSLESRNFVSARRAESAVEQGLSPIEQWEKGFGAFDEVRTLTFHNKKIDYKNSEHLRKLKTDLEYIINRTVNVYEGAEKLGKGHNLYREALGQLGVEYSVIKNKTGGEEIIITDMGSLVRFLREYQYEAPLIQKAKTGDQAALAARHKIFERREGEYIEKQDSYKKIKFEVEKRLRESSISQPIEIDKISKTYTIEELKASEKKVKIGNKYIMCTNKLVGKGTMGKIYAGYEISTGKRVVFKKVNLIEEKFIKESNKLPEDIISPNEYAKQVGLTEEPNLNLPKERIKMAKETIEVYELAATNLENYIFKNGPLSSKQALEVAIQVGKGLKSMHEKGMLHTDINLDNFLIYQDGKIKLSDLNASSINELNWLMGDSLGNIKAISPSIRNKQDIFHRSFEGGRLGSKAPELFEESALLHKSTDTYAFCISMYKMITGNSPYGDIKGLSGNSSEKTQQYLKRHLDGKFSIPVNVPESLKKILRKGIKPAKSERYQNMDELLHDLLRSYEEIKA